jgi:hypothetical protein
MAMATGLSRPSRGCPYWTTTASVYPTVRALRIYSIILYNSEFYIDLLRALPDLLILIYSHHYPSNMSSPVTCEYRGRIAVITIDNDKKLNSLDQDAYYQLATYMRQIATHDEVYITVLTGKGTFVSPVFKHI